MLRRMSPLAIVFLILAIFVSWNSGTLTAGEPVGDIVTVGAGGLPAVASAPDSEQFLVVWDQGFGMRARFVDSAGQPVGEAFTPASLASGRNQGIPAVTPNPDANEFLVTWWDARGNGRSDIVGQRLATDGRRIGGSFLIARAANFENWPPAVVYNAVTDEYLATWYQDRDGSGVSSIYGQRVSAAGERRGDVFRISPAGMPAVRPAVAANANNGEYLVGWTDISDGTDLTLRGRRVRGDGVVFDETIEIGEGDKPALAYNAASNEYIAVWADGTARASRVSPAGPVIDTITLSGGGQSKNFSDIAVGAAGASLAVWEAPGGTGSQTTVVGRELSANGSFLSPPQTLSGISDSNIVYPAVAYNRVANVYFVAWDATRSGERLVRGRIYRPSETAPPGPPANLINGDFESGFYLLNGESIAAGWAPFTLAGQPSFAGERSTVHRGDWSYKVSGHAPFTAGLAQIIQVEPETTYRVTAFYQLYPPGDGQALLGVRDSSRQQWVAAGELGLWQPLSLTVTPASDRLTITLQGSSGTDPNTNVYFDDVSVVPVNPP